MTRTRGKDALRSAQQWRGRRHRVVYVFTEGEVTEPSYIDIIHRRGVFADPAIPVEVRIANASAPGSHRKPVKLVEAAARLAHEKLQEAKRTRLQEEFWPQMWCLFDRDDHAMLGQALKQARDGNVRVAFPTLASRCGGYCITRR
ncbi:RloB family protein [Nonomuraea insulae]|uniref:RloB family protein n=1 Tax=Nonomuraea insulae TaxID=1616787 RepID=A0ABW1CID7_9ACTN